MPRPDCLAAQECCSDIVCPARTPSSRKEFSILRLFALLIASGRIEKFDFVGDLCEMAAAIDIDTKKGDVQISALVSFTNREGRQRGIFLRGCCSRKKQDTQKQSHSSAFSAGRSSPTYTISVFRKSRTFRSESMRIVSSLNGLCAPRKIYWPSICVI